MRASFTTFLLAVTTMIAPTLNAQDSTEEMSEAQIEFSKIEWQEEGMGKLQKEAEVLIPSDFIFTGRDGTERYLKLTGNTVGDSEMGIIAPASLDWWVLFEFDKVGYVKDDDEIDPDKLMKSLKASDKPSNEYRESIGLAPMWVDGWQKEPFYNPETNNLEWAIRIRDDENHMSVNYKTKILGRRGVMEAVLVCSPEELEEVLPEYVSMLEGYTFTSGNKYSEYKDGDKVAKYGLAALIAGGGLAVAAKTGLFAGLFQLIAKGGKAVIIGVIALFAGLWNGIKRIFGRD